MIGQCLAVELFDVLKYGKPYNNERYFSNLKALPKEPFDQPKITILTSCEKKSSLENFKNLRLIIYNTFDC